MIDFATAAIAVIVRHLQGVFANDTNRDNGPVMRAVVALAGVNGSPLVQSLAGAILAYKGGEGDCLGDEDFATAKWLVCRNLTTLAKIAKSKAGSKPATTPPVVTPPPAALDKTPRKSAPRKPRAKKVKPTFETTPDKGGVAPWEYDDTMLAVE